MFKFLKAIVATSVVLSPISAFAATTPNSFVTPQSPRTGNAVMTSSTSAGTNVLLFSGGTNGSRCNSIVVTTNDSSGHNIQWGIYPSGSSNPSFISAVSIIANQGILNPSQPLLTSSVTVGLPVDQYGNQYVHLNAGDNLYVSWNTNTISGSNVIGVYAVCADY